jgi:hypothetical protein
VPRIRSQLTIDQILAWADEYHRQHGSWPHMTAGPIEGTTETLSGVNFALYRGRRGLTGKASLAGLLREHRGVVVRQNALDEETIFQWATAHYGQTGNWPSTKSGAVHGVQGETWNAIHDALLTGRRGLHGGSSLAKLLADHGVHREDARKLRPTEILKWADSFLREHGHWPYADSGRVAESPKDTWLAIDAALRVPTPPP